MVIVEWGQEQRKEVTGQLALDALLDQIASEARPERPQDVQVTVDGAGTLGIVLGAEWSVLNHLLPHLDPPYTVSVGRERGDEPVAFYVAGDHYSETPRRNTISPSAARAAMRHFVATGELSPEIQWEQV
jgi:hypothetical protein